MQEQSAVPVTSRRFEVIRSMESFVADNLGALLKPVKESWQPSDFLPDMSTSDWAEQLQRFRERVKSLSDELLVVLVGDMITEEALPTYQTWLNRLQGVTDRTGADDSPWARWSRGWTAEENRHGDLLNRYLYLTGRVDMRAIETTVQNLISNGFDPRTENDPYLGFVYTSFQERATKISHRNVGTLAGKAGEEKLQQICGYIAGDEARHEKAYTLFMTKIFELDPAEAVRSFAAMMKKKIVMPAVLMRDNRDEDLYAKFSRVAQQIGVYTARDYADIVEHLVQHWAIARLRGLSDQAAKAQDYLCTLAARYRALAERISLGHGMKFSWIFDRQVV
jgi:acyl-[acyl-carrier-protein] desaturase